MISRSLERSQDLENLLGMKQASLRGSFTHPMCVFVISINSPTLGRKKSHDALPSHRGLHLAPIQC